MSQRPGGQPSRLSGLITRMIRMEGLRSAFDSAGMIRPDHIPAQVLDAALLTYLPAVLADWTGSVDPGDIDDALDQLADRLTLAEAGLLAHILDIADVHDASAISITDVGNYFTGIDVEAALAELAAAGGGGGGNSVAMYSFAPDAAPTGTVSAGDQQGNIYHSGPNTETCTNLYVDCETAPGASGLPIVIQYGDTDSLDTVSVWTEIIAYTLSSAKSGSSVSFTTATIPANRVIRMNIGIIVGTPADVTVLLVVSRPVISAAVTTQYIFTPDAAPGVTISAGNQQGNIFHSGPADETAQKLYVDAETEPNMLTGGNGDFESRQPQPLHWP